MIMSSKDFYSRITADIASVMRPSYDNNQQRLDGILNKHQRLTHTPAFYFENKKYGKTDTLTTQRLPKELESDMEQYLQEKDKIYADMQFFNSYIHILSQNANNYEQLKQYLPHELIPDKLSFFQSPEKFHLLDKEAFFQIYNYYKLVSYL